MRQKKSFIESRRKMREVIDMVRRPEPVMEVTRPTPKRPAPKAELEGPEWGVFAALVMGMMTFPFLAAVL